MSNVKPASLLLPLCDVELSKCPTPLIYQALYTKLVEFFQETQAWTCEMDRILVREGVPTYDLEHPSYALIDTVKSVEWDGRVLVPLVDFVLPSPYTIKLLQVPTADTVDDTEDAGYDEDDGLFVEVVLYPRRDVSRCVLPADLFDKYQEKWASGAIAHLKAMEGKAWSDAKGATRHLLMFTEAKNQAKFEQERGGTNATLTMTVTPGYEFE